MTRGDPFRLDGRVAVVTGASSGLGVGIAQGLARAGASVVLAARRADRLAELAGQLSGEGLPALGVTCDVTDAADLDRLCAETLEAFGRVDVLVNNAGITEVGPAEDEPPEVWDRVLAVNLTGVFRTSQRFGRVMLKAGQGSIVNVASVMGLVGAGQIPQASYAASKGAVVNLTRELAAQWARRGVRVNTLAPGWFASEMTEDMFGDERALAWIQKRTPLGRPGAEHELIGPAVFLASDASSYVTGQTLVVDGGWTAI